MSNQVRPTNRKPDHSGGHQSDMPEWADSCGTHRGQGITGTRPEPGYTTATFSLMTDYRPCNMGGDHIRNDGRGEGNLRLIYYGQNGRYYTGAE
jgi:hypothetical protein